MILIKSYMKIYWRKKLAKLARRKYYINEFIKHYIGTEPKE